jgi:hypothetical protein
MAGAGFTTFTAGSVLTAAQVNTYLMQQAVMVFTNEAARDAAITSPSEGMIAYLTAPTVPAATGDITSIPTGIKTIYNGSVWVCVTPIGAGTTATGTTTSATYTATLSGSPGTNPTVTLVTGSTAILHLGSYVENSTQGSGAAARVSVAVSGAGTVAASDQWGLFIANAAIGIVGTTSIVYGLTPGTNTFTMQYLRTFGGTGTFYNRRLTVAGIA